MTFVLRLPLKYLRTKRDQKIPKSVPSLSISMFIAAGFSGSPGISIISPVIGTRKPAPDEILISLTVTRKFFGLPRSFGLSDNDF